MAEIYLLRHAESTSNLRPETIGGRQNSVPLTPLGEEQARARGQAMKRQLMKPNIVAVSPAVRTRETARLALGEMDYHGKVYIEPDLQELSQGEAEGRLRTEMWTDERLAEVAEKGKDFAMPGGESVRQLGERMYRAVRKLNRLASSPQNAHNYEGMYLPPSGLAVTHEAAIKALIALIEDRPQEWVYTTRLANTSLTMISLTERAEKVKFVGLTY